MICSSETASFMGNVLFVGMRHIHRGVLINGEQVKAHRILPPPFASTEEA